MAFPFEEAIAAVSSIFLLLSSIMLFNSGKQTRWKIAVYINGVKYGYAFICNPLIPEKPKRLDIDLTSDLGNTLLTALSQIGTIYKLTGHLVDVLEGDITCNTLNSK